MKITLDAKTLSFNSNLFFLRLYYKKLLEILEIFCGQGSHIAFRNEQLNGVYTVLKSFVEAILAREDFKELAKSAPQLFESLIGDIEETDIEWDFLSKEAYAFLGKIEKLYIFAGNPIVKIPKELMDVFTKIDKIIVVHKKHAEKEWVKILKVAKENKHLFEQKEGTKIKLSSKKLEFDDKKSIIKIDNKECPITPHTRKHMVCRVMFRHKIGEPVSWDKIYYEMMGEQADKQMMRIVQDAMYGVNNDIKKCANTEDNLFNWKNRNVIRNF